MSHPRHQPRGTASGPEADRVKLRLRLPTDGSVDLDQLRAALEARLQRGAAPVVELEPVAEPVAEPDPAFVWKFATVILFAGMMMIIAINFGGEKTGSGGIITGVGLMLLGVGGWLAWSRLREAKPAKEPFSLSRFVKAHPYLSGTIALAVVVSGTGVGLILGGKTSLGLGLGLVGLLMLGAGIALVVRQKRKAEAGPVEELPEPGITAERPPLLSWPWLRQHSKAVVAVAAIPVVAVLVIALMSGGTGTGGISRTVWILLTAVGLISLGAGGWWLWSRMRKAPEAEVETEPEPVEEWREIESRDAEPAEPTALWERIFGQPLDEEVGLGRTVAWIKTNPKKTAGTAVAAVALLGLMVTALFYGISSIPTDTAQVDPKPKVITPTPIPTPTPRPVEVEPKPPVESADAFRPAEGYEGRLAAVLIAGGLLGYGGFQLRRRVAKAFLTPEAKQAVANAVFVDFWPGFRHFVAAHGGYLLVAAAMGAVVLIADTTRYEFDLPGGETVTYDAWAALSWTLAGMGLAGLGIMGLGAMGINLMPRLDRHVSPAAGGSAAQRFALRKVWHIVLIGLILGALISVWRVEHIRHWWDLWLKWTLSLGLVAAAFWKKGELAEQVENVRPLPKKTQAKLGHVLMFNLPLLAGLALPLAFVLHVLTGFSWLNIGWLAPSAALGILLGMGLLMKYPRLLRHWLEIIFFPSIVAFICDWLVWGNSFWFVFAGLAALFAFGKVMTQPKDTESGRLLIFPPRDRVYRPVRTWEKDNLKIRWSGLLAVAAFILLTLAAAGKWVWSGAPEPQLAKIFRSDPPPQTVAASKPLPNNAIQPTHSQRPTPKPARKPSLTPEQLREKLRSSNAMKVEVGDDVWAQYDLALLFIKRGQGGRFGDFYQARWLFQKAAFNGHAPSAYNAGVCWWYKETRDHYAGRSTDSWERAIKFLIKSHSLGHPLVSKALGSVYFQQSKLPARPNMPPPDRAFLESQAKKYLNGEEPILGPLPLDKTAKRKTPPLGGDGN